jgi:hypothetical protein
VSEPPLPLDQSAPQDGDVLVAREAHSPVRHTVRQLPGSVQFSAAVRDEAVRLARGFGQKHAVDVWYSENGAYRLFFLYRDKDLSFTDCTSFAIMRELKLTTVITTNGHFSHVGFDVLPATRPRRARTPRSCD